MNDKQIRCFIQAATYLNFHKAAEQLFISQPAMTYQIASLEKELGYKLFDRDRPRLALTSAGSFMYGKLLEFSIALDGVLEEGRRIAHDAESKISVAWPPSIFDRATMANIADQYAEAHPEEAVTIAVADRVCSIDMLEDATVDVTFTLDADISRREGVVYLPLFVARRACLVSATHPLASRPFVTWDMLQTQTLLLAPPESYPDSYQGLMEEVRAHVPAHNTMTLEDVSSIDINVAAGKGVALRPVAPELMGRAASGIVAIPFRPAESFTLCVAYRKAPSTTLKRAAAFAQFAHEYFQVAGNEG